LLACVGPSAPGFLQRLSTPPTRCGSAIEPEALRSSPTCSDSDRVICVGVVASFLLRVQRAVRAFLVSRREHVISRPAERKGLQCACHPDHSADPGQTTVQSPKERLVSGNYQRDAVEDMMITGLALDHCSCVVSVKFEMYILRSRMVFVVIIKYVGK